MDGIYINKDERGITENIELRGMIEVNSKNGECKIYYVYPDTINTVSDVENLINEYEDYMYYSPIYIVNDFGDVYTTFHVGHCMELELPEGGTVDSISAKELFDFIKNKYVIEVKCTSDMELEYFEINKVE